MEGEKESTEAIYNNEKDRASKIYKFLGERKDKEKKKG